MVRRIADAIGPNGGATLPSASAGEPAARLLPRRHRGRVVLLLAAPLTLMLAALLDLLPAGVLPDTSRLRDARDRRVPIAVLGDSDSHGYHDTVAFEPGSGLRGGVHRSRTLQWTEVLARLRGSEVDLGDVAVFGGRRRVVQVMERLGFRRRAPRKLDHEYNLAFSGAHCRDLNEGVLRQVPRLLTLIARDPERWRRGVVVVRIGIVELGGAPVLRTMARAPDDAALAARLAGCVEHVTRAVRAIRGAAPDTAIVLVGVLDNVDHPPQFGDFRDPVELANVRRCLDRYDRALADLAAADPRVSFFDDRAWFRARWGGRAPDGRPAYGLLRVAPGIEVVHGLGDDPTHSVLMDGHAGLVWSVLWAQALVEHIARRSPITPITDEEVVALLRDLVPAWRR